MPLAAPVTRAVLRELVMKTPYIGGHLRRAAHNRPGTAVSGAASASAKDRMDEEARGKSGGTDKERRRQGNLRFLDLEHRLRGHQRSRGQGRRLVEHRAQERLQGLRQLAAFDQPGAKADE